jgi:hypothetical protein
VDGIGAELLGCSDVLLRVEVARDLDDLVRCAGVQRRGVVGRCDGDRGDPELAARAKDPHCDLASICHEQLLDRHDAEPSLG